MASPSAVIVGIFPGFWFGGLQLSVSVLRLADATGKLFFSCNYISDMVN